MSEDVRGSMIADQVGAILTRYGGSWFAPLLLSACATGLKINVEEETRIGVIGYEAGSPTTLLSTIQTACIDEETLEDAMANPSWYPLIKRVLTTELADVVMSESFHMSPVYYFNATRDAAVECGLVTVEEMQLVALKLDAAVLLRDAQKQQRINDEAAALEAERLAEFESLMSSGAPLTSASILRHPELWKRPDLQARTAQTMTDLFASTRLDDATALVSSLENVGGPEVLGKDAAETLMAELVRVAPSYHHSLLIEKLYPDQKGQISTAFKTPLKIEFEGFTRSEQFDLMQFIGSRAPWLDLESKQPGRALVIEKSIFEINDSGSRTETVIYANHQVNLFSAALLMPKGASYHVDVERSEIVLQYAYFVQALDGPSDPVRREGRLSSLRTRCMNPRIVNVFGGVTSAGFVANEQMKQMCEAPQGASRQDLESQASRALLGAIAEALRSTDEGTLSK